jgi:pimeloyl-ACP methyl ester carboxylesterase
MGEKKMREEKRLFLPDPSDPARQRRFTYGAWGEADNPRVIVCVHGLTRQGRDFDWLAQSLASEYRIFCPDMAGRGASDPFTDATHYNYLQYLGDLHAMFQAERLSRITWIGTSMGGILGMMLAAGAPALIERMALNDIGSRIPLAGLRRILSYAATAQVFPSRESAMAQLRRSLASFGLTDEKEWEFMFQISFTRLPNGDYKLAYDPAILTPLAQSVAEEAQKGMDAIDLSGIWEKVACPILLLRGAHSDILPSGVATAMCERNAPTQLVECESGHAPALLASDQIETIRRWLKQTA